jgi:hypothetical protein
MTRVGSQRHKKKILYYKPESCHLIELGHITCFLLHSFFSLGLYLTKNTQHCITFSMLNCLFTSAHTSQRIIICDHGNCSVILLTVVTTMTCRRLIIIPWGSNTVALTHSHEPILITFDKEYQTNPNTAIKISGPSLYFLVHYDCHRYTDILYYTNVSHSKLLIQQPVQLLCNLFQNIHCQTYKRHLQ